MDKYRVFRLYLLCKIYYIIPLQNNLIVFPYFEQETPRSSIKMCSKLKQAKTVSTTTWQGLSLYRCVLLIVFVECTKIHNLKLQNGEWDSRTAVLAASNTESWPAQHRLRKALYRALRCSLMHVFGGAFVATSCCCYVASNSCVYIW